MSIRPATDLPLDNLHATDISPHSHVVQFYTRTATLMNGLGNFVRASLRAGESVVIVATDAHRRDLQQRLKASRIDLREVTAKGRLQLLDAAETLDSIMVDGKADRDAFRKTIVPIFDAARAASRSEFQNTAAFGEMVALLAKDKQFAAAIELERFWNEFARTTRLVLHCAYPVHLFAEPYCDDYYLRICREHTNVLPA